MEIKADTSFPGQSVVTIGDRLSERGVDWAWYSEGWNLAITQNRTPEQQAAMNTMRFAYHHQPFAYFDRFDPSTPRGRAQRRANLRDARDFESDLRSGQLPPVSIYSSTYNDAPMPHMERLTWDGIALHAGKLPGYPASHGCVRLPAAFAAKLYDVTQVGTPVIIAADHTQPGSVIDPGLILGDKAKAELAKVAKKAKPKFTQSDAVTSILVSSADKAIYVLQNGEIVAQGKATIANPSKPLGSHVFVLQGGDEKGFTWQASGFDTGSRRAVKPTTSVVERVAPPENVQKAINERMKPGMVFITTDDLAGPDSRSSKGFVVMDAPAR